MGTKAKPGKFDCYANADNNEPMFILLARDPVAPILTELWALLREEAQTEGDNPEHLKEAREVAKAMRAWRKKHRPGKRLIITQTLVKFRKPKAFVCAHVGCMTKTRNRYNFGGMSSYRCDKHAPAVK